MFSIVANYYNRDLFRKFIRRTFSFHLNFPSKKFIKVDIYSLTPRKLLLWSNLSKLYQCPDKKLVIGQFHASMLTATCCFPLITYKKELRISLEMHRRKEPKNITLI